MLARCLVGRFPRDLRTAPGSGDVMVGMLADRAGEWAANKSGPTSDCVPVLVSAVFQTLSSVRRI